MKKTYIIPTIEVVQLGCGTLCEGLIIGSGNSASTSGDGEDLTKEERSDWSDIWND